MRMPKLDLKIIPSKWQICAMCHAATECSECPEHCRKINKKCLGSGCQACCLKLIKEGVKTFEDEVNRYEAWLYLVTTHENMKHLKKYFIKK